ncbi:MAG: hypothetical protein ACK4UQ_04455 [Brevundimonas sp.]
MERPFWLGVGLALSISLPTSALACSPLPFPQPEPTQAVVDDGALRWFREADYVAEIIVERSPRHRRNDDAGPPPPGRLRVVNVIKGEAPAVIIVPLPDICEFYFMMPSVRWIVAVSGGNAPQPLTEGQVASLRRRGFGDWAGVH